MLMLLRLCWRAYDLSLRFYPAALCDSFGAEMSEIFRCQTLEAWTEQGWAGLLPVVWCGAKEFFSEGVCPRASSPAVVSGATSLLFTSVTFGGLLWAFVDRLGVKAFGDRL